MHLVSLVGVWRRACRISGTGATLEIGVLRPLSGKQRGLYLSSGAGSALASLPDGTSAASRLMRMAVCKLIGGARGKFQARTGQNEINCERKEMEPSVKP